MADLAVQTDLLLLRPFANFDQTDAGLRVVTRGFPTYWFGNILVVDAMPDDPCVAIETFQSAFATVPDIHHITYIWGRDPLTLKVADQYRAAGFEIGVECALATKMPRAPVTPLHDIVLRPIETDGDWDQVVTLNFEVNKAEYEGYPDYLDYVRQNIDTHRRRVDFGLGHWFGAFHGEKLVSNMGLFAQEGLARYQDVGTDAQYRSKGIASALIHYAAQSIQTQHPVETFVIVAMDQSDARRLYLKCGFELRDHSYSACCPPPHQA